MFLLIVPAAFVLAALVLNNFFGPCDTNEEFNQIFEKKSNRV